MHLSHPPPPEQEAGALYVELPGGLGGAVAQDAARPPVPGDHLLARAEVQHRPRLAGPHPLPRRGVRHLDGDTALGYTQLIISILSLTVLRCTMCLLMSRSKETATLSVLVSRARKVSVSQNSLTTAAGSSGVCCSPTMTRPRQSPRSPLAATWCGRKVPGEGPRLLPSTTTRSVSRPRASALSKRSLLALSRRFITGLEGSNQDPLFYRD